MGQVLVVTEMLQTLQKQSKHEVLCSENDGQNDTCAWTPNKFLVYLCSGYLGLPGWAHDGKSVRACVHASLRACVRDNVRDCVRACVVARVRA